MRKTRRIGVVIAALLIIASAVPTLGNSINPISSVLNFYRLIVVFLTILTIILFHGEVRLSGRQCFTRWMTFMILWVVYGVIMLVISPYADTDRGVRELLSLVCGVLCFYTLSNLHLTKDEIETVLRVLFFVLVVLVLIGFVEIATGKHMATSMFSDPENEVIKRLDIHSATGFMYNINDFSALITLMLPVAIGRFRIRLYRAYIDPGWILVACVWFINRANDANICVVSMIIGVMLYFIIQTWKDRRGIALVLVGLLFFAVVLFVVFFFQFNQKSDLLSRTFLLMDKSAQGQGSIYSRTELYKNAINASWMSGFLGLGPGGYPTFFSQYKTDTALINPHSLLMEILSQYGLLIFLAFVLLLVSLYRRSFKLYSNSKDYEIKEWGRMGMIWVVTYILTSFAPSSYIQFSFHWTLLALICLITETAGELTDSGEEEIPRGNYLFPAKRRFAGKA